ncbi:hypothetical protein HDU67_004373 [Dinochytrium kinnereticum]|nr:hypothetical protein HDU67_004373 [Dinochytrium kinnereticum]
MASFHHFQRVATRFDLGDAHRLLLSQRELLRAIASASFGRDEAALNEVLHRAAAAASTTLAARPQLILPPPSNPSLAAATWTSLVSSLRHAVHVARESLPVVGGVAAVAAVAAIALHVTSVWIPHWAEAAAAASTQPSTRRKSRRATVVAASETDVTDLVAEVTALRAELQQYRNVHGEVDGIIDANVVEGVNSASYVANLEAVNKALAKSVETLEAELEVRKAAENGLRGEVERLKGVVDGLTLERERDESRMRALEGSLDSLRVLFSSIAAASPLGGDANLTAATFSGIGDEAASFISTTSSRSSKRRSSSVRSADVISDAKGERQATDTRATTMKTSILIDTTSPIPTQTSADPDFYNAYFQPLHEPPSASQLIFPDLLDLSIHDSPAPGSPIIMSSMSEATSSPRVGGMADAAVLQVVEEEAAGTDEGSFVARPGSSAGVSEDGWEDLKN